MSHEDDGRIALEQEIADLRFALRQATDRASLAEVKCSQLLSAGMLTDTDRGDAEIARLRLEAAHAEIERLHTAIRRLADQDATLSVQGGAVTVTMDDTLTDAEREAVESAIGVLDCDDGTLLDCSDIVSTLRNLLERTK
jgi:hypothetical protein